MRYISSTYYNPFYKNSRSIRHSFTAIPVWSILLFSFILFGFTNSDSKGKPDITGSKNVLNSKDSRHTFVPAKIWVGTWSTAPQLVCLKNVLGIHARVEWNDMLNAFNTLSNVRSNLGKTRHAIAIFQ